MCCKEWDESQEFCYPVICRAIAADYDGYVGQEFTPKGDPLTGLDWLGCITWSVQNSCGAKSVISLPPRFNSLKRVDYRSKEQARTMFKFHEGQSVALREDRPSLGLKAGDTGVVWALYATEPPAYEVAFGRSVDVAVDMTDTEDEVEAVDVSAPQAVRKPGKQQVKAA
jgi:hypothetical protein